MTRDKKKKALKSLDLASLSVSGPQWAVQFWCTNVQT